MTPLPQKLLVPLCGTFVANELGQDLRMARLSALMMHLLAWHRRRWQARLSKDLWENTLNKTEFNRNADQDWITTSAKLNPKNYNEHCIYIYLLLFIIDHIISDPMMDSPKRLTKKGLAKHGHHFRQERRKPQWWLVVERWPNHSRYKLCVNIKSSYLWYMLCYYNWDVYKGWEAKTIRIYHDDNQTTLYDIH